MNEKLQKTFRTLNILLLVCAMTCLVCYDIFGGLWLKGLTSCWFAALGRTNLVYARKRKCPNMRFLYCIAAGLVFGMCADVLLGVQSILGIVSFALGHVCYLIAFYTLEKPKMKDLFIVLPIAVASLFVVTGTPYIQIEDPLLKKLLLGYAVIIACMLGKAISNLDKSSSRRLICLGCAMFWFSDVMLAIDMFGTASRLTWVLCSYTYWPAQNILAHSIFHFVNEHSNGEEKHGSIL